MLPAPRLAAAAAALVLLLGSLAPANAGSPARLDLRGPRRLDPGRAAFGQPGRTALPGARAAHAELEVFRARRQLVARAQVRGRIREGERRLEALRLRSQGDAAALARAAERWDAEATADARRDRIDLDALERRTGWRLRPRTRALLALRLERVERDRTQALRRQLEALRAAVGAHTPRAPFLALPDQGAP